MGERDRYERTRLQADFFGALMPGHPFADAMRQTADEAERDLKDTRPVITCPHCRAKFKQ